MARRLDGGGLAGSSGACADIDELRAEEAWEEVEGPNGATSRVLDAASGTLVAGNFYELVGSGTPGEPDFVMKIYWVPDDPDVAEAAVLTVRIENLDEPSEPPVLVEVGGDDPGAVGTNAFSDQYFWASGIPLPTAARWRLTASAPGGSQGCFEFTLPSA